MKPSKSNPPDEPATVVEAINLAMPEKISWMVQSGAQSWSGRNIEEFIRCVGDQAIDKPATLSLTLLFSLGNQNQTK